MLHFFDIFPEVAKADGRLLLFTDPSTGPTGAFLFTEYYCIEPGCDCRRVIVKVVHVESTSTVATINHSFEAPTPDDIDADLGQTFLDPLNEQSNWSPFFMKVFLDLMLDHAFAEGLVRHYEMVKAAVDEPQHPRHLVLERIRRRSTPIDPIRSVRTGRNASCPCGSGKKYKRCCSPDAIRTR